MCVHRKGLSTTSLNMYISTVDSCMHDWVWIEEIICGEKLTDRNLELEKILSR